MKLHNIINYIYNEHFEYVPADFPDLARLLTEYADEMKKQMDYHQTRREQLMDYQISLVDVPGEIGMSFNDLREAHGNHANNLRMLIERIEHYLEHYL